MPVGAHDRAQFPVDATATPPFHRQVRQAARKTGKIPACTLVAPLRRAADTGSEFAIRLDEVLLDVTLPGLSSREILQEAGRIRPELKVILTSAYGEETVSALFAGLRVERFIRKPFGLGDLFRLLSDTLAS